MKAKFWAAFILFSAWATFAAAATLTQNASDKTLTVQPSMKNQTVSGTLLLQNPSGDQPRLHLSEDPDNGVNYLAHRAPATLAGDFTFTWPADDGLTGQGLTTDGSGVLSWSNIVTNPMDSAGDMIYGGALGVATKLDAGTSGQILISGGAATPVWTSVLPLANGGTNKAATAVNGGLVWSDADSLEITAAGTASQWVLSGGAGTPTMSNTTTTGKFIDGSADEVQLTVQGHSAQTANVFAIQDSSAVNQFTISNIGRMLVVATGSEHGIRSNITTNQVLQIQNDSTSTSADDDGALSLIKGSTTATTSQIYVEFQYNAGGSNHGYITGNGANNATFTASSDSRLKENIVPLTGSLGRVVSLRPVEFDYKAVAGGGHQYGFIAQEMEEVFPRDVSTNPKDGMKQISGWGPQMAELVQAIKELKAELDAYKAAHP